jgi:thiaminase
MDRESLIRLAREADMVVHDQDQPYMEMLERFAQLVKQHVQIAQMPKFEALAELVRNDEREACAKVCEQLGASTNGIYERNVECATAIRVRGEK